MVDGRIVHDVAYGIGDANLAELDRLDAGAVPTMGITTTERALGEGPNLCVVTRMDEE